MLPLTPAPQRKLTIDPEGLEPHPVRCKRLAPPLSYGSEFQWSVGESNPRYRLERPASWPLDERTFFARPRNAARPGVLLGAPGLACGHATERVIPGRGRFALAARRAAHATGTSRRRIRASLSGRRDTWLRWVRFFVSVRRVAAFASMTHDSEVGSPKIQISLRPLSLTDRTMLGADSCAAFQVGT